MRLRKSLVVPLTLVLAVAALLAFQAAAFAAQTCSATEFPALPGGESGIKVACSQSGGSTNATAILVHDYKPASGNLGAALWHPGAARVTAADAHITSGSATVTSATANFNATYDINRGVSGPGIPVRSFIKSVTNATTAVLNQTATATTTVGVLKVENSANRTFKDGHTTSASGTVTSASANFQASDVGAYISGQGLKPGTKITARTSATQVTVSPVADATSVPAGVQLSIAAASPSLAARYVTDAHTTTASTTVTSATGMFSATDKGISITGAGIPANTQITAVASATSVTISHAATATSAAAALTIGAPTVSAPANNDIMTQLGAELELNPTLVASSDSCSEGSPEGFELQGKWENPGSYVTAAVLGTPVSGSIAQILYPTSVLSFAAYVVPKAGGLYDVSFPSLPTSIAACPTPHNDLATTFTWDAITASQSAAVTDTALPSTNYVRALYAFPNATASSATTVQIVQTIGGSPVTFSSSCTVTRQTGAAAYACGQG